MENSSNVDYWTPENPTNNFPRPNRFYGFGKTRYSSTLKYEKGSFVKVRDVTLAYNIPSKVLASLGLGRARIYATSKKFTLPSAALIITIQNEGRNFISDDQTACFWCELGFLIECIILKESNYEEKYICIDIFDANSRMWL